MRSSPSVSCPGVAVKSPSARWGRAAAALAGPALLLLALVVAGVQPVVEADGAVARAAHAWVLDHPGWREVHRFFSDVVWDPWTMRLLLAVSVVLLWCSGQRPLAGRAAVAGVLCAVFQQSLKALVGRERPVWEQPVDSAHYAAMPSGHSMTAAFTCVLLLWLVRRVRPPRYVWWPVLAVLVPSIAGVSATRVVLGVHWPTDTVVGSLLGASLAAATAAVHLQAGGAPSRR